MKTIKGTPGKGVWKAACQQCHWRRVGSKAFIHAAATAHAAHYEHEVVVECS